MTKASIQYVWRQSLFVVFGDFKVMNDYIAERDITINWGFIELLYTLDYWVIHDKSWFLLVFSHCISASALWNNSEKRIRNTKIDCWWNGISELVDCDSGNSLLVVDQLCESHLSRFVSIVHDTVTQKIKHILTTPLTTCIVHYYGGLFLQTSN